MSKITIAALIYQSPSYAIALYDSLLRHTPALHNGQAQFYYVANDPTPEVLAVLQARKIPYFLQENPVLRDDELWDAGYDPPEYMRRVYQGWNRTVIEAHTDSIVLLNSDMFVSPGWLEALQALDDGRTLVSSWLVEPAVARSLWSGAIQRDFGCGQQTSPDGFREQEFLAYAEGLRQQYRGQVHASGAYMPTLFPTSAFLNGGGFPEGNPIGTYGDRVLFQRLIDDCYQHITALDSIVYHVKEGETREYDEIIEEDETR